MKNLNAKELDKDFFDARELVESLCKIISIKDKNTHYPKFTKREVYFLADLILKKPYDLALYALADFLGMIWKIR